MEDKLPPKRRPGPTPAFNYDALADALKEAPDKWVTVLEVPDGEETSRRHSMFASALARRGDGFEVTSRSAERKVYARWVAPEEEEA